LFGAHLSHLCFGITLSKVAYFCRWFDAIFTLPKRQMGSRLCMMHATSNKNLKEFGEEGEEYTTHAFEGMQIQELQELQ